MAVFPNSIFTFPLFEDDIDTYQASHQNVPYAELTSVMSSLGVGFTGSFANITSLWNYDHGAYGGHISLDGNPNSSGLIQITSGTSLRLSTTLPDSAAIGHGPGASGIKIWGNTQFTDPVSITNDLLVGGGIRVIGVASLTSNMAINIQQSGAGINLNASTADRFQHKTTTKTVAMNFADMADNAGEQYRIHTNVRSQYMFVGSANNSFNYASFPLSRIPNKTVLDGLEIDGTTATTNGEIQAKIWQINSGGGAGVQLGTTITINSAQVNSMSIDSIGHAIDTTENSYFIELAMKAGAVANVITRNMFVTFTSSALDQT
jgi:hypothetical protein